MKPIRAERVVLGVVAVILLFIVVCPPFEFRGCWVHFWLGEALRLDIRGPEVDASFEGRLLLIELAVLGTAVGWSLLTGCVLRRRSGALRLTRSDRVLVIAILAVMLLLLFPPFLVEEGSWTDYEYVAGESHVAHRVVIASRWDSDEYSDVYLELLVGEVAVVVVVAAVLMVVLRQRRTRTH